VVALALVALAAVLTALAPRVMSRRTHFREAPRAALVAWQAVAFAGALSALAAAPVAVLELAPTEGGARNAAALVALAASGVVLASLLVNGHVVGTRLRAARRRHRDLLDLVGEEGGDSTAGRYRVVPHETPTAYCVPGLRGHVVLTEGTLRSLEADELGAVLAHERAHLTERHDLVLEFFTVLHRAAPQGVRAPEAMREVQLLIEVMADRAARRVTGDTPLARALVELAGGSHPTATLGVGGAATLARMELLGRPAAPRWKSAVMYAFAIGVIAAPLGLVALAFGT
jgi:Zn-dependent protease with chaperone function